MIKPLKPIKNLQISRSQKKKMSKIIKRYEKLQMREYEICIHYYPSICKELSLILRNAYTKIPKNLQSLLLEDILTAFRFLPQVENRSAMEAANLLLQAAEAVLPKQKKVLAVSEFKRVVVALKRRQKNQKDVEGIPQLPIDLLFQIFGFLDTRSLVIAGLVCWSWNSVANDNKSWQSQYEVCFGGEPEQKFNSSDKKEQVDNNVIDWKHNFKQTYIEEYYKKCTFELTAPGNNGDYSSALVLFHLPICLRISCDVGIRVVCILRQFEQRDSTSAELQTLLPANSSRRFSSNRGYCDMCNSVVWLSNMKCSNEHYGVKTSQIQIEPVSPQQIVEHLLGMAFSFPDSDSDSGSDSEFGPSKLWDYGTQWIV